MLKLFAVLLISTTSFSAQANSTDQNSTQKRHLAQSADVFTGDCNGLPVEGTLSLKGCPMDVSFFENTKTRVLHLVTIETDASSGKTTCAYSGGETSKFMKLFCNLK